MLCWIEHEKSFTTLDQVLASCSFDIPLECMYDHFCKLLCNLDLK